MIRSKILKISLILLATFISNSNGQLKDCSKYIEILYDESKSWIGNLSLSSNERMEGVSIDILFDEPIMSLSTDIGRASTKNRKDFLVKDDNYVVESDKAMSVIFEVRYGKAGSKPSIKAVKFNDKVKCSNDPSIGSSDTQIPATTSEIPKILTTQENYPKTSTTTPKSIPTKSTQMKSQEKGNNLMKSRFTIPLSELEDKHLIEVEFDREVLSLTSDAGDGESLDNRKFEINIEGFDTDLYGFEKGQDNPDVEFFITYHEEKGDPKILNLKAFKNEDKTEFLTSNKQSSQQPDCFYVDVKKGLADDEHQDWRFLIEIPSDILMESNSFHLTFDKDVESLRSFKGDIEKLSDRTYTIRCNLMDIEIKDNYVNLIFTAQCKISCWKPNLVSLEINQAPFCLASLELSEDSNSTSNQKFSEGQISHGGDCLQLSEVIDNKGNWEASLRIPALDSSSGLKIRMLFDKIVSGIESNFGEISTQDSKTYFISDQQPRASQDGPLTVNMTLMYDSSKGFPEFIDISVENNTFCVTRAKLVLYSGPPLNQHENSTIECVRFIEMFSRNGDWSALLQIPPFESYSGTHVQLTFDRKLVSLKADNVNTYTFDYKTFVLYNPNIRRFVDGIMEIRMLFQYDTRYEVPDLKEIYINSQMPYCTERAMLTDQQNQQNSTPTYSETTTLASTISTTTQEPLSSSTRQTTSSVEESTKKRIFMTSEATTKKSVQSSKAETPLTTISYKKTSSSSKQKASTTTTQSYFDIVSSKYNDRTTTAKSPALNRPQKKPTNIRPQSAKPASYYTPIVFPDSEQTYVHKVVIKDDEQQEVNRLLNNNIYLHLHFPSNPFLIDGFVNGFSENGHKHLVLGPGQGQGYHYPHPETSFGDYDKKLIKPPIDGQPLVEQYQRGPETYRKPSKGKSPVPAIESLKNLGRQNTFYNYFGDSQYITYSLPNSQPQPEDFLVIKTEPNQKKISSSVDGVGAIDERLQIPTKDTEGRSTTKKKKKGFFMPKLALFVRNS